MRKEEIIKGIEKHKIIAIIRSDSEKNVAETAGAIIRGGVPVVEIALNTPGAPGVIEKIRREYPQALIGAGTVITPADVDAACDAGALFMFSPVFNPVMVERCRQKGVVSIPGIYTPTEAYTAMQAGADFIKLFPANLGGPGYVKTLLAPLPECRIIAVGGVNAENMASYLQAGALAVGSSSMLFSKEELKEGRFDRIEENVKTLLSVINP